MSPENIKLERDEDPWSIFRRFVKTLFSENGLGVTQIFEKNDVRSKG